jgi:hypothetical protein
MNTGGYLQDPILRTAPVSWASQTLVALGIIGSRNLLSIRIRRPEPFALAGGFCFIGLDYNYPDFVADSEPHCIIDKSSI